MFEAVNSVLSNASLLRGSVEQLTSARDTAVQTPVEAPKAPYISPHIHVDANFDKAVIQIRDSETGDVLKQFPSKETLQARARRETLELRKKSFETQARSSNKSAQSTSTETAQSVASANSAVVSAQESQSTSVTSQVATEALSVASSAGQEVSTFATQA